MQLIKEELECFLRSTPSTPGFCVLDSPLANLVGDSIQQNSAWIEPESLPNLDRRL